MITTENKIKWNAVYSDEENKNSFNIFSQTHANTYILAHIINQNKNAIKREAESKTLVTENRHGNVSEENLICKCEQKTLVRRHWSLYSLCVFKIYVTLMWINFLETFCNCHFTFGLSFVCLSRKFSLFPLLCLCFLGHKICVLVIFNASNMHSIHFCHNIHAFYAFFGPMV